jgi:two-component system cell cycle sensor histidine kinase/response regulator CckA
MSDLPLAVQVLLVEDDEEDYLLTKDLLGRLDGTRHVLHWVSDSRSALRVVEGSVFDVCLVDYRLGSDDGIELVRHLVANSRDMPVIILTGHSDRDVDVEATRAGAADYLVKGEVSPALLERTIRYAMRNQANLRVRRVSEERLRRAQRIEAVGRLAGGIAHDFNNLMSVVIGFAKLLQTRVDGDVQGEYVDEIIRAGERATALTNQLLAFSRKQVLQPKILDLNGVVAGVDGLLHHLTGENVELVRTLDPALEPVKADPGQLEQVIMNLVVNARDAIVGPGKVTIETANVELDADTAAQVDVLPGSYVSLAVRDTGVGMDADTVRQIFEPFFTTKEEGKGTGLGLATVFGIVKQSGGGIAVETEPGHGTSVNVYLPHAYAPVDRVETDVAAGQPAIGSETILLVEDEAAVRRLERTILEESGYRVIDARNADQALELAAEHDGNIDLLLTDVAMPGLSGPELAGR